ncbi:MULTISPECIES: CidA/LrgA family protein [Nocardioides]|uniref:CidA/LrgA family protein n=1 Tax=Nocardioides TaxID=1839 RepID=UPI00032E2F1B|nr:MULTISPECIES: CidA/LrgA family protein [Nocardioides]EON25480.1 murein hydrolase regulator LrgA [Nocardioides sp. CF8]
MINGLMWLLVCQVVGEVAVRLTDAPVPGPIVGMVLLFALLQWRDPDEGAGVLRASDAMLRHLQLFFVPAGVGIVTYLAVLRADALPIVGAMAVSWLAGLLVVGWLVTLMTRRT